MGTLKNFFKYVGIFLGICLAVVLVVLGAMVLFKFELFGYKYVKISAGENGSTTINYTGGFENAPRSFAGRIEGIDKVTIEADNLDVIVQPWTNGDINSTGDFKIVPNIQASGFAKVNERGAALVFDVQLVKYTVEGSSYDHFELIIKASCPTGLVRYGSSSIIVKTPYLSKNTSESTNKTTGEKYYSPTSVFGDAEVPFDALSGVYESGTYTPLTVERINTEHIKQLSIKTTTGNITITDALKGANNEVSAKAKIYVDNLITETGSGNLTLHRCGVTNLNATSDTGNMKFEQLTNYSIPGNVAINNNRGKISFDRGINLGYDKQLSENKANVELNGSLCQVNISTLNNVNLNYTGDADYIEIGSILNSTVQVNSVNARIKIGSIYSNGYIHLSYNDQIRNSNQKGNRRIEIGYIECGSNFGLSTWNNPIIIGTLVNKSVEEHSSTLMTESGNITVNELIGNTDLITKSGNITVKQRTLYDSNENDTLAQTIANKRYEFELSAKQKLLEDLNALIEDAIKTNDSELRKDLNKEIQRIENTITEIQTKINTDKTGMATDENYVETKALRDYLEGLPDSDYRKQTGINTIYAVYNHYITFRSNIYSSTISGTVNLVNLSTCNVDAQVRENGKATMYIQMAVLPNEAYNVNIVSGVGNVNLYTPNNSFWVYAKRGKVHPNYRAFFVDNDLDSGYCRATLPEDTWELTERAIKVKTSEAPDGEKTVEEIKGLEYNYAFVTIDSTGGDTTLDVYDNYKAQ